VTGIYVAFGVSLILLVLFLLIATVSRRYVKVPPTPMRVVPSMLSSSLFPAGKGLSLLLHSLKGFPGF